MNLDIVELTYKLYQTAKLIGIAIEENDPDNSLENLEEQYIDQLNSINEYLEQNIPY